MSLTDYIQAKECAVVDCRRARVQDSLVCETHLTEMWANRLDRCDVGFEPREPEWMRRRRTIGLPAKDYSSGNSAA